MRGGLAGECFLVLLYAMSCCHSLGLMILMFTSTTAAKVAMMNCPCTDRILFTVMRISTSHESR